MHLQWDKSALYTGYSFVSSNCWAVPKPLFLPRHSADSCLSECNTSKCVSGPGSPSARRALAFCWIQCGLSACLPLPRLWQSQNLVNVRHTRSTSCSGYHVMQQHPLSAIIFIFTIILVLGAKWISCPIRFPFRAPEIQIYFFFNIWTKHKNVLDTK